MTEKRFKAYVGDPDFHDGVLTQVRQESGVLSVEVEGYSGVRYSVRFTGVESLISHDPEGMVLYALVELEDRSGFREFHFGNSNEPGEEGGNRKLEIIAQNYRG